jgi:hypothetical protein
MEEVERSDLRVLKWLNFSMEGRDFYVLVALGVDTTDQDLRLVESLLDSLQMLPATTPTTAMEAPEVAPGWTFAEIPFMIREGSTYATGGHWFFAWSGAPDVSGHLMADGLLADLTTGQWTSIPVAPIEPRYMAATVWTGAEFIVFGGHSFSESFVDGAAFDPATGTWRTISPAPMSPAPNPTVVWTGDDMVVWLAGEDSGIAEIPSPNLGQLARYNTENDAWTEMNHPEMLISDAALQFDSGELTLIGGPLMQDLPGGLTRPLQISSFDETGDTWSEPIVGPEVDSGRAFRFPDGHAGVLVTDGFLYRASDTGWEQLIIGPPPYLDEGVGCWTDLGATNGRGVVYLRLCGYIYLLNGSELTPILAPQDYGATSNLGAAAFLATEDGRLVTIGDADLTVEFASGTVVFGVYDPAG